MKIVSILAAGSVIGLLAACAQQEEPPMRVAPEPTFDKFGGGSCTPGYVYVPGAVPELAVCIPEDECQSTINADGSVTDCPPPQRYPERRRSDGDNDRDPQRPQTSTAPTRG